MFDFKFLVFLIARGVHCECLQHDHKAEAMLKSQPTNTCLENHSREHCHAILEQGGSTQTLYLRKAAKREYFLPSAHQTQMQQI